MIISYSAAGGEELWMIGKNFLKDCVVVFQESSLSKRLPNKVWAKSVEPLKDYFNSTHLIVVIPPYVDSKVREAVTVNVTVKCGGKESDVMALTYNPVVAATRTEGKKHLNEAKCSTLHSTAVPYEDQVPFSIMFSN